MAIEPTGLRLARTFSAVSLALLIFVSALPAQTGDWKTVQNLPAGAHVLVKAQRRYYCELEGVTDDELLCAIEKRRSFGTTVVSIPRAEVREVRTPPNQGKSTAIGAGIGAATGAAIGATSKTAPGPDAFFLAVAGAGAGALVGAIVPVVRLAIHHGKVIYKR